MNERFPATATSEGKTSLTRKRIGSLRLPMKSPRTGRTSEISLEVSGPLFSEPSQKLEAPSVEYLLVLNFVSEAARDEGDLSRGRPLSDGDANAEGVVFQLLQNSPPST